eukprot:scaffold23525_cov162-Isochrysis_galbana.AAC.2
MPFLTSHPTCLLAPCEGTHALIDEMMLEVHYGHPKMTRLFNWCSGRTRVSRASPSVHCMTRHPTPTEPPTRRRAFARPHLRQHKTLLLGPPGHLDRLRTCLSPTRALHVLCSGWGHRPEGVLVQLHPCGRNNNVPGTTPGWGIRTPLAMSVAAELAVAYTFAMRWGARGAQA